MNLVTNQQTGRPFSVKVNVKDGPSRERERKTGSYQALSRVVSHWPHKQLGRSDHVGDEAGVGAHG